MYNNNKITDENKELFRLKNKENSPYSLDQ